MKLIGKLCSAVTAAAMLLSLTPCIRYDSADAATNVSISPDIPYEINGGKFEGWGSSLCWWANRVGYSDTLSQKAADLFYGEDGLRLNIARFNIGGGDDPTHDHITRTDSNMPGYTKYNNGNVSYDWSADANQRNVLMKCIDAAGDDMIVEMFSNSPPYYMCKSGCSTGNTNAGSNNLKDDYYDDFAEYLAEVCYHYEHDWGVDIQSIDPMNEPYTDYWGAFSKKQEGCHFDQGESMNKAFTELDKSLKKRGLNDIIISGCDESVIDTQITSFNKLSDDAKRVLGRIDTHTYGGSKRTELKDTAIKANKNLWMSEVDGSSTAGSNAGQMGAALWFASRITQDCNDLNCSAWIMWQLIDNHISSQGYNGKKDSGMPNINGGFWGVAVADHDKNDIILTKKYYAFGQYSRYIRPGMIMLKSSSSTLAAYDKENKQLVIVAVNTSGSNNDLNVDLSQFGTVGDHAQTIRTSANENWKDVGNTAVNGKKLNASLAANSVTTFIIDNVSGGFERNDKIDLSNAVISGSKSWKDSEYTCEKAFDGNNSSYFDGVGDGYVQVDLGQDYDLTAIGFCPRKGYEYRAGDGKFMVSSDGENWSTVYTISGEPSFGMHYVTSFEGPASGRYVRYQVPSGAPANSFNKDSVYCCNIAEIELYGSAGSGTASTAIKPVSVTGSNAYKDSANDSSKAFDGNNSTYFDGVGNGWVQADLGDLYDISAISFCPRDGYEYRAADGVFSVSQDGQNWKDIYTISGKPDFRTNYIDSLGDNIQARYVRYQVPEGKPENGINKDDVYCCNIAEIAVYGTKAEVAPVPTEAPTEPTTSAPTEPPTEPTTAAPTEPPTEPTTAIISGPVAYGDVTLDGNVGLADALAILQYVANATKYHLEARALDNADVYSRGDGVTAMDALSIQKYDAKVLTSLPESYKQ